MLRIMAAPAHVSASSPEWAPDAAAWGDLSSLPYDIGKVVGKGTFGVVFRARSADGDETFAIKCVSFVADPRKEEAMLRELQRSPHDCILRLRAVHELAEGLAFVFPLSNRTLHQEMKALGSEGRMMPTDTARGACLQMALGLAHCHARNILHGDAHLGNFLVPLGIKTTWERHLGNVLVPLGGPPGPSMSKTTLGHPSAGPRTLQQSSRLAAGLGPLGAPGIFKLFLVGAIFAARLYVFGIRQVDPLDNDQYKVQLADFGLSHFVGAGEVKPFKLMVALQWRPPELLLEGSYGLSVDVWSFGCSVGALFWDCVLFRADEAGSEQSVLKRIFKRLGAPTESSWPGFDSLRRQGAPGTRAREKMPWAPRLTA